MKHAVLSLSCQIFYVYVTGNTELRPFQITHLEILRRQGTACTYMYSSVIQDISVDHAGMDPGISERGSKYSGGFLKHPPEAIGCFIFIMPNHKILSLVNFLPKQYMFEAGVLWVQHLSRYGL